MNMPKTKIRDDWKYIQKEMSKEGMKRSFISGLRYNLAKDRYTITSYDGFLALSIAVRDRIIERWIETQQSYHKNNVKRVYYLSLEFLIGRLLGNNILNLGIWDDTAQALEELGFDVEKLRDEEVDAGLGNGGLGRLAACFLDSMATLGIPAHGYGIRYDYGIFHQKIVNGYQVEAPDEWLKMGNPWEFARPEYAVKVQFYGHSQMFSDSAGGLRVEWVNSQDVVAMPYDIPILGHKNDVVNTLRLWSARSSSEFDLEYFNDGDYERAVYDKMFSENISKVLYPNDSNTQGRELRLKQEYFFTAASIADIIRRFKVENPDFKTFPDKAAIQLNDTHPALAIVEFLRILLDREGMQWEEAWDVTVRTFAYTNHTLLPEALECWAVPLVQKLLPRHMQLIFEINARFLREVANAFPGDTDRLRRMSLIEEGSPQRVRMANLALVGSHAVNGVSELHSNLLKSDLFKDFYEFFPEKFQNKTNGITQRRWLQKANRSLSALITEAIGEGWGSNLYELEKLANLKTDAAFRKRWAQVKQSNKRLLANFISENAGVSVSPDTLFDVQVKRIHEYKRQLMFGFYVIREYLRLKQDPSSIVCPRTFIMGGKAAPGYFMAKLTIKFINNVANVINHDRSVKDLLKVVFLENYRVSLAEKIFPASDLSEQISTAGKEASGTGCMKFMMNGALTVGTLDGANIEMAEAVGKDNIFIFGLTSEEVQALYRRGYHPQDYIDKSPMLRQIFRMIRSNFFSPIEPDIFKPLTDQLSQVDPFLVCADFDAYCAIQDKISRNYLDQEDWVGKAVMNVAKSGKFSSDRTIMEYAREIWDIGYQQPK